MPPKPKTPTAPMNVRELIGALQAMPQEAPVYRYCDEQVQGVNLELSTPHPDDQVPDFIPSVVLW